MRTTTDKILGYITLIAIALLCVPLTWFTLGGDGGISTGWTISPRIADDGEISGESVVLIVDGKVSDVYVNVGEIYGANDDGGITFTIDFADSETSIKNGEYLIGNHYEYSLFNGGERTYGWTLLASSLNKSQKYVKFTTNNSFVLNEIVFTDEKGNRLPTSCYGAIVWRDNARKFVLAENDTINSFTSVVDEQDGFELSGTNLLNERESELQNAISNLRRGSGYYVSKTANVLGVELAFIGTAIFGETAFGLRIIPFVFFVATLYLLYFFAKKIFGGSLYGTTAVICYLLAGIGLCIGGLGLSYSTSAFFAIASLRFAYELFIEKMQSENKKIWLKNLFMSTLFLTLAVLCDITALVILPFILSIYVVFAIRIIKIRAKAYNEADGLEKEYNREKLNSTVLSTVLGGIVCFIVVPLLLSLMAYLFAFPTYAGYYRTENVFAVTFKNFSRLYASLSSGTFFGWIIGLGSQTLGTFDGEVYISANKAFVVLSTLGVATLIALGYRVKNKKIINDKIKVGVSENEEQIRFFVYAYCVTLLSNFIFIGKNEYHSFVFTLIPAVFCTVALFKAVQRNLKNKIYKGVAITIASVVVLFFLAQFVTFIQVALPTEIAKYLYAWTL